jgi:hypothetical protein
MIEDKDGCSRHTIPEEFEVQATGGVKGFTASRATGNKGRLICCERRENSIHKEVVDVVWTHEAQRPSKANRYLAETDAILHPDIPERVGVS